jgi:hypothetical protein
MSRGAFIDPKGVRWDTNDADYEGYLSKQSRWVKGISNEIISHIHHSKFIIHTAITEWRKRYCILKGSKVFYSKVCVSSCDRYLILTLNIDLHSCPTWNDRFSRLCIHKGEYHM